MTTVAEQPRTSKVDGLKFVIRSGKYGWGKQPTYKATFERDGKTEEINLTPAQFSRLLALADEPTISMAGYWEWVQR